MRFIKENSYMISRLLVTQLGMMVFAMVLSTAAASFDGILIFVSIFSVLFYLVLLHVAIWPQGAKDVIRVEAGRAEKKLGTGFLLGTVAAIPSLFLFLLMAIGYVTGYGIWQTDFGVGLYGIVKIILSFWQAPYLGIMNACLSFTAETGVYAVFGMAVSQSMYYFWGMLLHFVTILPAVLVSGTGYLLGYKNIFLLAPVSGNKNKQ